MIQRYECSDISALWSDQARHEALLKVELAILEEWESRGTIPTGTRKHFNSVKVNVARALEIEATTKHDVIAFCTSISEQVSKEAGKYFHFGVTSSDVLDTALALQLRLSIEATIQALDELMHSIRHIEIQTEDLLGMGRTHGMFAEPMIFAQKFLGFRAEFLRRKNDYAEFLANDLTGKISGAVGNYTLISPEFETAVLTRLGLQVEPVSTQVIPRDRISKLINIGALTASAMERLMVEIRHLHHSDLAEVTEGFSKGQKGSSIMPHKKNPVSSENLSGIARMIRSHSMIALENCVLWHERDISHSSNERMMLPDHFGLLVYALRRAGNTLKNLEIHRKVIQDKVKDNPKVLSSYLLHELIQQNTASREELYPMVQEVCFKAKTIDELHTLLDEACKAKGFQSIPAPSLSSLLEKYLRHYDQVKTRVPT